MTTWYQNLADATDVWVWMLPRKPEYATPNSKEERQNRNAISKELSALTSFSTLLRTEVGAKCVAAFKPVVSQ